MSAPITAPPIVLVHGAWHGPWCWDQVAGALRTAGHRVHVVTLPDHDRPGQSARLWTNPSRYMAELARVTEELGEPAVLVGHSMGGYVVQRHLETHQAAGAVLLASVPRRGVVRTTFALARRRPLPVAKTLATFSMWPAVADGPRATDLFLGPDAPEGAAEHLRSKMQNESYLAFLAMLVRWPRPKRLHTRALVVAADGDVLFTVAQEQDLARALQAPCEVLVGSGHDVMLDARWEQVARLIDDYAVAS